MKIFCIGFNKTGTTSLQKLFNKENLLSPLDYYTFEQWLDYYISKKYSICIDLIKKRYNSYNFFQDIPFSFPHFYKELYKEYPNAYYILSVRNNSEEWYSSLMRYYKLRIKNFNTSLFPTTPNEHYIYKYLTKVLGAPLNDPYNKVKLMDSYNNHNKEVKDFFQSKGKLIEINLSIPSDFNKLQNFLNIKFKSKYFPHLNKSK